MCAPRVVEGRLYFDAVGQRGSRRGDTLPTDVRQGRECTVPGWSLLDFVMSVICPRSKWVKVGLIKHELVLEY
jgi:hypothetical protein